MSDHLMCLHFYYPTGTRGPRFCTGCNAPYDTCPCVPLRLAHDETRKQEHETLLMEKWGRKFINTTPYPLSINGWTKGVNGGEHSYSERIDSSETKMFHSIGLSFWSNGWSLKFKDREEEDIVTKVTRGASILTNFEGRDCMGRQGADAKTYSSMWTFWSTISWEDDKEVFTIHYDENMKHPSDMAREALVKPAVRVACDEQP
jgi:hypothetical protein